MLDIEEWTEEYEIMVRLINDGKFLNAAQALEVGKAIAEGMAIGLGGETNEQTET